MNIMISNTNTKGQIVIPAAIRQKLGITAEVPLHISLKGNTISIVPIKSVTTINDQKSTYLQILTKTQGSWAEEKLSEEKRKELERKASMRRRTSR
jgi:AbrB family looped-hinge helix DNA binding protein